jgi:hypothetical protein
VTENIVGTARHSWKWSLLIPSAVKIFWQEQRQEDVPEEVSIAKSKGPTCKILPEVFH